MAQKIKEQKITVTPPMIGAGAAALEAYRGSAADDQLVEAVYIAMWGARPRGNRQGAPSTVGQLESSQFHQGLPALVSGSREK